MLLDTFIKYVKIGTQSDSKSNAIPSTSTQLNLANQIKKDLADSNINASIDKYGRVYVYLPGNNKYDPIGLCAHMDTAEEISGDNVNPIVIKNYNGKDIPLSSSGYTIKTSECPKLKELKGKTLITTSGDTLLGGDDKAGVAIIVEALKRINKLKKEERHPTYVVFTCDEEIGRGYKYLNQNKFKAKYAYTFDGGSFNEANIENFNAVTLNLEIIGKVIHPGDGKNRLLNASLIMCDFVSMLDKKLTPYNSENHEGFNHIVSINGATEKANAKFIIRAFTDKELKEQINDFYRIKDILTKKYKGLIININTNLTYQNMYKVILKNKEVIKHLENAYKKLNIPFTYLPVRGGTDGARFAYLEKPIPTPNLGTGSYNHHGRFEFAVLEEMEILTDLAYNLIKI